MKRHHPTLKRHKRSGNAYARVCGRQMWFGPYDDPEAHRRFARTVAELAANDGQLPSKASEVPTVGDVVSRYFEFAERHYCSHDGIPTREIEHLQVAVRPLLALYETLPIPEFGIRPLKTLREQLIARNLSRKTINDRVNRLLRIVCWATEEELCEPSVYAGLKALRPLQRGRSRAKESKRVLPVSWAQVEPVLPLVTRPVAGLLELMWHTGMRPGEACALCPGDVDCSGTVWFYQPKKHKMAYLGRERLIAIGPKGQAVLAEFMARVPRPPSDLPLFSPKDALAELAARRRGARATPMWSSHEMENHAKRRSSPVKKPGEAYTPNSLRGAVSRACKSGSIPTWTPNQLRHAAATRIRKELGLEAARAVLGHSSTQVTEIYAELDQGLAADVMRRLG